MGDLTISALALTNIDGISSGQNPPSSFASVPGYSFLKDNSQAVKWDLSPFLADPSYFDDCEGDTLSVSAIKQADGSE